VPSARRATFSRDQGLIVEKTFVAPALSIVSTW
jgi:hypothetical protein